MTAGEGSVASLLERYHVPPAEIEARSMALIETLAPGLPAAPGERQVVLRMVHAAGDPGLTGEIAFSPGAVESGVAALRSGAPVFVDVRMAAAGVSEELARRLGCPVRCLVDHPDAARLARERGITRAAAGVLAAAGELNGAVVAVGNAPTALLALLDLAEGAVAGWPRSRVRPALVIGVPVGFVHAAEAKEELRRRDLPFVTLPGTRGGTPLAVAALNALLRLAVARSAVAERQGGPGEVPGLGPAPGSAARGPASASDTAVLFLGHGSRANGANDAMYRVMDLFRRKSGYRIVEAGFLELSSPSIPEAVDACVALGARRILVIPYFLHLGLHVQEDLPEMLANCRERHPGVEIVLGPHIGFHPLLADILVERVREAESLTGPGTGAG